MPTKPLRRKRIRLAGEVYANPGTIALVTACTAERRPVFSDPDHADLVVAEIGRLHGDAWRVLGYCVMPDHVHALILIASSSVVDFVRLLKGRTAAGLRPRVQGTVWQRSFHDHLLRRNEDILETLRYLFENPVRRGLVREWHEYLWCGSLQWPDIGPDFFALDAADVVWPEMFGITPTRGRG